MSSASTKPVLNAIAPGATRRRPAARPHAPPSRLLDSPPTRAAGPHARPLGTLGLASINRHELAPAAWTSPSDSKRLDVSTTQKLTSIRFADTRESRGDADRRNHTNPPRLRLPRPIAAQRAKRRAKTRASTVPCKSMQTSTFPCKYKKKTRSCKHSSTRTVELRPQAAQPWPTELW